VASDDSDRRPDALIVIWSIVLLAAIVFVVVWLLTRG
jgi:hypothetical protein